MTYGNIEVKEILNKCELKANCGNISIGTLSIKENSSIKADLGNIEVNKAHDIYIDAKVDLGDVKIEDNARHSDITLKIKSDCGDIKVGE